MAKLRLLVHMKHLLRDKVAEKVDPKAARKAVDTAYNKAEPLLLKALADKFKPSDMLVLKKYDSAKTLTDIRFLLPDGGVEQFSFRTEQTVPETRYYLPPVPVVHQNIADAVMAWVKANTAYLSEHQKRTQAYNALIESATYLEDLLEVWPEAASIVPNNGMLIALGPDQIATIKEDLKERE